jgi:D-alanyl-D-alanine carboxypeptidase
MNRTARALGMTRTTFRNAHGLTEDGHMSTARDMTLLGRRLVYDYPQYYNIFSRREDDAGIAQVRNTNRHVLNAYAGADGIKTGYTRAAGFNLVASAQRGQERIIATVFGGRSAAWRNQRIMELLDMGFARAPSNAPLRVPGLPQYDNDGPTSDGTRAPMASCRAASPDPARPWRHPNPRSSPPSARRCRTPSAWP